VAERADLTATDLSPAPLSATPPIRTPGLIPYAHLIAALLVGFALRLFFILKFPFRAGDTQFYEELALNWLHHGVYGLVIHGRLIPVDMRVPGYPAFLAVVYSIFGQKDVAVMIVQAVIDLLTCVITAHIAARIAPAQKRRLVAIIALWLAALCPFTADYAAAVLTETLATFLGAIVIWMFVIILNHPDVHISRALLERKILLKYVAWFFIAGVVAGLATLVRPESPLLLIAMGLVLCGVWWHEKDWWKVLLGLGWLAASLLLTLTPWALRNVVTLKHVQYLAPRYAQTGGDYIPVGFYKWTDTWMIRFGDSYLAPWQLGWRRPILIDTLPASAFDSAEERTRIAALLALYNSSTPRHITPPLDDQFAAIARDRARRHPLRTYLAIPIERAFFMWFTPRIELLPYSGDLWPPAQKHHDNPEDFDTTAIFGLINIILIALAAMGAWRYRASLAVKFFLIYLIIRTAFMTQLQTVEPRYVLECFPIILALAALALARILNARGPAGRELQPPRWPELKSARPKQDASPPLVI